MIRYLQSTWLTALVGCMVYLAVTAAVFSPAKFAGLRAALAEAANTPAQEGPSWKFQNPEFDQWVDEIRRQRDALAQREQQLQDLQTRVETERQELNTATQTVFRLQSEFDQNVIRISQQEMANLKRQAKVLASMSPDGAAALVRQMNEDEAVRILVTMKPDEASPILEALGKLGDAGAKRAATLTERMRRTLLPETPAASPNSS